MKSSAQAGGPEDLDSRLIQLNAELRRERDRLAAELEAMGAQNVELAFQVGELEEQLAGLRSERDQALSSTIQMQSLTATAEDLRAEAAMLRSRASQQDARLAASDAREREARAELAEARQALDEALREGTRLQEKAQGLGEELDDALRERDQLLGELASTREALLETQASLAQSRQSESQRLSEIEGLRSQLAESDSLREELKESRLQTLRLEEKVCEFKRQLLDRSAPTPGSPAAPPSPQGQLAALLEENLGTTGRVLLDKARDRCGVAPTSADPADLQTLAAALKEPALRLCRTPQQRGRLERGLSGLLESPSADRETSHGPGPTPGVDQSLAELLEADPHPLPGRPHQRLHRLLQESVASGPRERLVLSLLQEGLEKALQVEVEAPARSASWGPELVTRAIDPELEADLAYILDEAVPRSGLSVSLPSPDFATWASEAQEPPSDWLPAEVSRQLAEKVFGTSGLRILRGRVPNLAAASSEPGPVLILHQDLERTSREEAEFLVGRELFRLHRRHVHLVTACQAVDGRARARLIRRLAAFLIERGTDLPPALLGDTSALWGTEPPERIRAILDELYRLSPRPEILHLQEFLVADRPFQALMDREADHFAMRLSGLGAASAALVLREAGPAVKQGCEREGFQYLYRPPVPEHRDLRQRLQRLWADYLE